MNLADHELKYERNLQFELTLRTLQTRYPEWEVVALYYAAVHTIDAHFRKKGVVGRIRDHHHRKVLLRQFYPRALQVEYRTLEDYSRDARYDYVTVGYNDTKRTQILQTIARLRNHR